MTLMAFGVEGFKAFSAPATFFIRPLTMVYGYNSAGKSSLIRLLPLVRDSLLERGETPFAIHSKAARGANPIDLFSKKSAAPSLTITFTFAETKRLREARYDLRVFGSAARRRVVIERLRLTDEFGKEHSLTLHLPSVDEQVYSRDEYSLVESAATLIAQPFQGLLPKYGDGSKNDTWTSLLAELRAELDAMQRVLWIGPLRSIPGRIERDLAFTEIDSDGSGASDVLSQDDLVSGPVVTGVREWFEANTEYTLRVVRGAHEFGALHSVAFAPKKDPKTLIPVEDTGEGMAQVLPTLTAGMLATSGRLGESPIVLLEHPDLHLHSTVHGALLRFFSDAAKSQSKPRFVLETHSEAMLLAVQNSILDGQLAPSDFVLHWVQSDSDGNSSVKSITFDDQGYPTGTDWPVFDWYASVHKEMQRLSSKRLLSR